MDVHVTANLVRVCGGFAHSCTCGWGQMCRISYTSLAVELIKELSDKRMEVLLRRSVSGSCTRSGQVISLMHPQSAVDPIAMASSIVASNACQTAGVAGTQCCAWARQELDWCGSQPRGRSRLLPCAYVFVSRSEIQKSKNKVYQHLKLDNTSPEVLQGTSGQGSRSSICCTAQQQR